MSADFIGGFFAGGVVVLVAVVLAYMHLIRHALRNSF